MTEIHDLTVNPDDLPCQMVNAIVLDSVTGKEWKPRKARYDRNIGFWFDENNNILNFDRFIVNKWSRL